MRFLVLGAGALGGYFGARLLQGGADVTFLVRPRRAGQLARDGLVVRAQDGEFRSPVKTVQQGEAIAPADIVLLTCKAYDLDGAIAAIRPAMGAHSAVFPVLNGMRHIDVLKEAFGPERVLGGLTTVNTALLPDGVIQQSALKVNFNAVGELDGHKSQRCTAFRQALEKGGLPIDVSDNIVKAMWSKFFGFASIATIASLTRSRAGAIARSAVGRDFVTAVLDEGARIAAAEGYPAPSNMTDIVHGMFSQVGSSYGPSILVDMEEGRTTEGEHTIGDMVQRARKHGIAAPILTAALCNLQAYELNRAQPKAS
jgi:2-dehydropantoate 2-reductase